MEKENDKDQKIEKINLDRVSIMISLKSIYTIILGVIWITYWLVSINFYLKKHIELNEMEHKNIHKLINDKIYGAIEWYARYDNHLTNLIEHSDFSLQLKNIIGN